MKLKPQNRRLSTTLMELGGIRALGAKPREEKAFFLAKINWEKGKVTSAQSAAKVAIDHNMKWGFYLKAAHLARDLGMQAESKKAAHAAVEQKIARKQFTEALEISEEFGILAEVPLLKDLTDLLRY